MARFLARRLVLSLITLWLLATIVFIIANVLPNDVGRTILGPVRAAGDASTRSTSGSARTTRSSSNTSESIVGVVTFDFGDSFVTGQPVLPQLVDAIGRSAKLAGLRPADHDPHRDRRRALRRPAP